MMVRAVWYHIRVTLMVPITQGGYTLVDDEDAHIVGHWRWRLFANRYPGRGIRPGGRHGKQGVIYLHRAITDAGPGEAVDHINGDPRDNRRANLRIVSKRQNNWNKRPVLGAESQYKGVGLDRRKGLWTASIGANGVSYSLGTFEDERIAAATYNGAAIVLHGQYAWLNRVDPHQFTAKGIASTPALEPSEDSSTNR